LIKVLVLSGSPWFQIRGCHSAIYNALKGVARLDNAITLLYPTLDYSTELENAREVNRASLPGFELVPVNVQPVRSISYYVKTMRDVLKDRLSSQPRFFKEFSHYLSLEVDHDDVLYSAAFINAARSALGRAGYDIIQVDYPRTLKIIDFLDFDLPKVFVNHEIQSVRAMRTLEAEGQQGARYEKLVDKVSSVEGHFLRKYDAVIALTETDSRALRKLYSLDPYISPHAIDTDHFRSVPSTEHVKLIYPGGETHYPNKDAVRWFCTDIAPILDKKLKNYRLYVTGKWSDEAVGRYSSDNVLFTGFVDDLREYLSGAICIAPIRIGSGMRVKILEAMSMECGVVSTSVGCEGLNAKDGEHLLLAETAGDFAENVVRLARDADLYTKLGSDARELVIRNFSVQAAGKRRLQVYEQTIKRHEANRRA
jgi:glycosyltransferase involved in cell wall biosynthesis